MPAAKKNTSEAKPIGISMSEFNVLEHQLVFPKPEELLLSNTLTKFKFNIKIELAHSNDLKRLYTGINVEIYPDEKVTLKLGQLQSVSTFLVQNPDDILRDEKGGPILSDEIAQTMTAIAVGSTRGVMAHIFRGTILERAILPLYDLKELLANQIQK